MNTQTSVFKGLAPFFTAAACAVAFIVSPVAHAQTLSRGPYLQNGSTSAVTIRWRTSANADSVVRYGTSAGSLTQTASNATLKTEHEIRLTGLAANTTYYYSVGTSSTTLASGTDYFVVTAPTGAKPTRIWVLGDPGTGSSAQTSVRTAYYNFTGATHTDLWLMLGDNAYSDGTDAEYTAKLFNIYPTMLRKSVLWPTLGNHDGHSASSASQTGPYYDQHTLPKAAEAGGVASGTEAYYSFDYGNIHFVCLNSNDVSRSSTGTMANWLRNDLAANSKDWLIAFFHHPPYSKGSHNSDSESNLIEMRQNILPILEDYGVDLVLCGHSHSYERSKFIDGHYGSSTTLTSAMIKNGGSGREGDTGAYTKTVIGPVPHEGAVYAVPGSSGQTSGGSLNHPAMYVSLNVAGSMILDINGNRLDAKMLDNAGAQRDSFTLLKGGGGGNVAPTVSITSPVNGATFTTPASVTINASAADSDGTVTQVAFYAGSTLLATDTTAPYSTTWSAPAGSHSLTAIATDNLGATRTSTAVSISVNNPGNVAPTASITSPANGATFTAPATVTINATASDSDGTVTKVDFYVGSTLIGTDTTSPYSFAWSATVGTHSLTARATDNGGATGTSAGVSVTVNNAGGSTVLALQNGTNGYNGMVDASLRSDGTTTNYGSATTLLADGSPDYSAVMKWDVSSIPVGKQVTAATITFNVTDESTSSYELYALKRAFVESEVTWTRASVGVNWATAGANNTSSDRETTVLGAITGSAAGTYTMTLNASGIAKVQAWVNNAALNYGLVLLDFANSNGLDVSSSEASTVSQRPKLTVTYQ